MSGQFRILAVDPGSEASALVLYDPAARLVQLAVKEPNDCALSRVREYAKTPDLSLVVERIACYGMPVGEEVLETVWWSGRFAEAWGRPSLRIKRLAVKLALCHDSRAKDANIRQAVIDRFGGKAVAIGLKKSPGPLYGIKADLWQALGLALTAVEAERD